MILALDIGNSQIFCGVFDGDQLKVQVRYASKAQISSDESVSYTHLRAHET